MDKVAPFETEKHVHVSFLGVSKEIYRSYSGFLSLTRDSKGGKFEGCFMEGFLKGWLPKGKESRIFPMVSYGSLTLPTGAPCIRKPIMSV